VGVGVGALAAYVGKADGAHVEGLAVGSGVGLPTAYVGNELGSRVGIPGL